VVEYIGQRDKDQAWAAVWVQIECKADGKYDQACGERYAGVQNGNPYGFVEQRMLFPDVAAEDGHTADTETQRKERLVHGCYDGVCYAVLYKAVNIRQQVEFQTGHTARQHDTFYCKRYDQNQKGSHDYFCDFFSTFLQPYGAASKACDRDDGHPEYHRARRGKHSAEHGSDLVRTCARKGSGAHKIKIVEHPAGDGGVVHHQKIGTDKGKDSAPMPAGALRRKHAAFVDGAGAAGAAYRELYGKQRNAEYKQEKNVYKDKDTAAVQAGDIRKFPDVADADRTSCGQHDKSKARSQCFSFLHNKYSIL